MVSSRSLSVVFVTFRRWEVVLPFLSVVYVVRCTCIVLSFVRSVSIVMFTGVML